MSNKNTKKAVNEKSPTSNRFDRSDSKGGTNQTQANGGRGMESIRRFRKRQIGSDDEIMRETFIKSEDKSKVKRQDGSRDRLLGVPNDEPELSRTVKMESDSDGQELVPIVKQPPKKSQNKNRANQPESNSNNNPKIVKATIKPVQADITKMFGNIKANQTVGGSGHQTVGGSDNQNVNRGTINSSHQTISQKKLELYQNSQQMTEQQLIRQAIRLSLNDIQSQKDAQNERNTQPSHTLEDSYGYNAYTNNSHQNNSKINIPNIDASMNEYNVDSKTYNINININIQKTDAITTKDSNQQLIAKSKETQQSQKINHRQVIPPTSKQLAHSKGGKGTPQKGQQLTLPKSKQAAPRKTKESVSKKTKQAISFSAPQLSGQVPFLGETIVLTGEFQPYSKDQIIQLLKKLGASCPKSFAKKTTCLLQGAYVINHFKQRLAEHTRDTSKSQKAQKQKIKIVPNEEIDDYFKQKTGKTLEQLFEGDNQKLQSPTQRRHQVHTNSMDSQDHRIGTDVYSGGVLWTNKYRPLRLDDVIGHKDSIKTLVQWLKDWGGTDIEKAVLLSGNPGIGKTTIARLLAVEFDYQVVEFNASDVRNKSKVGLIERTKYSIDAAKQLQKRLLLMDECDGMSGGDRGGIAAIIDCIKHSSMPIICICNDKNHPKIKSLGNHCLHISMSRPDKRIVTKHFTKILEQEDLPISELVVNSVVEMFQNDIRASLEFLQFQVAKLGAAGVTRKSLEDNHGFMKDAAVCVSFFDASRNLLIRNLFQGLSLQHRMENFYIDSEMVPLMIYENYLDSASKTTTTLQSMQAITSACDAFVLADQLETRVRRQQAWSLMPSVGFLTSVYAPHKVSNSLGFPKFPAWFGKFSSQKRHRRLTRQLTSALRATSAVTSHSGWREYGSCLYVILLQKLSEKNIEECLQLLVRYHLTPAMLFEHLHQMQFGSEDLTKQVSSKAKAELTKSYSKMFKTSKILKDSKKGAKGSAATGQKYNPIFDEPEEDQEVPNQELEKADEVEEEENSDK